MDSNHSLLPTPRQELVGIPHKAHGVALSHAVSQQLRRGQTYILWAIFGAIVILNSLFQWEAAATLQGYLRGIFDHDFITKLSRGQQLVYAFAPLLFGRLADVYSRPVSSALALLLFILGFIISAASLNAAAFAVGTVLHTMGTAGIGILAVLFIADYSSLRWRGVALSSTYLPTLITMWAGPALSAAVPWRWIYGMATILVFVICTPAIYLLLSAAHNYRATNPSSSTPQLPKLKDIPSRVDLVGLLIFTLGSGLIEYSPTSVLVMRGGSSSKYPPGGIAMLVIGSLLVFPVFVLWELYFASFPFMPGWALRRKGVLFSILVICLFRLAYAFSSRTLGDFAPLGWNVGITGYLFSTSAIAYAASAPLFGVGHYVIRRSKPFLIVGIAFFIVGCGLWVHVARHWDRMVNDNPFAVKVYLFTIQALIGVGTIAVEMSILITSQASVTHDGIATATVLVFSWLQVGSRLGTSAAIAVSLRPDSDRTKSIISLGLALGLSLLCLPLSLFIPNFTLGDKQNTVEEEH